MSPSPPPASNPSPRPRRTRRGFFLRGLAVVLPAILTVFVFVSVGQFVNRYVAGPGSQAIHPALESDWLGWAVLGGTAGTVVVVASLLILVSSLNVNFLGLPRVAYGLSQNGLAPKAFSKVDAPGTPRHSLYLISAWIALLALSGAFELLLRFMMTIAITVDTIVLLGYFRLRAKRPDMERPFTIPGHPVLPIIPIALYVLILAILLRTHPPFALRPGAPGWHPCSSVWSAGGRAGGRARYASRAASSLRSLHPG